MNVTKVLYFHGGPGFNGQPERELLTGVFLEHGFDLRVWDEPSAQRPEGPRFREERAFENLLERAEDFLLESAGGGPVVLMGHSFGAFAACHLARTHQETVRHVILVSPALGSSTVDRNILTHTMLDFRAHGDDLHLELQQVLDRYSGSFDANTERGFELIVRNPRLFEAYWTRKDRMAEFVRYYARDGFGIDLHGFMAVRRTLTPIQLSHHPTPATVIFGENEVIVSPETELGTLRASFEHLDVYTLRNAAHYPHVERTADFLKLLGTVLNEKPEARGS